MSEQGQQSKYCNIINIVDAIIGACLVIDAIAIINTATFLGFVLPIYFFVFGIFIFLFAIWVPQRLSSSLAFYFSFLGRGLTFLFIGCIVINFTNTFSDFVGGIMIFVAFVYIIIAILTMCTQNFKGQGPATPFYQGGASSDSAPKESKQSAQAPPSDDVEMGRTANQQQDTYGNAYDDQAAQGGD